MCDAIVVIFAFAAQMFRALLAREHPRGISMPTSGSCCEDTDTHLCELSMVLERVSQWHCPRLEGDGGPWTPWVGGF